MHPWSGADKKFSPSRLTETCMQMLENNLTNFQVALDKFFNSSPLQFYLFVVSVVYVDSLERRRCVCPLPSHRGDVEYLWDVWRCMVFGCWWGGEVLNLNKMPFPHI